jgi:hypothetical protein
LTKVLKSSHTEKLGVTQVERVCALARTIFRPTSVDDVGIDGFIELVENGIATGIIAGVQIKSGESFIDNKNEKFRLMSDQAHFGYWARCSFPVIGIIYSPKLEKAVWLNLTELATDKRIVEGPYTVTVKLTNKTEFTPANLLFEIAPVINKYTSQRRTLWQIEELLKPKHQKATLSTPSLETSNDKTEAWAELVTVFLDKSSTNEEIADAGYRLSWHLPSVPKKLQNAFIKRLNKVSDFQLVRILEAIDLLLQEFRTESMAELIGDLLIYTPDICNRIEGLLKEQKIPAMLREAAIQVIELKNGEFNEELREEVYGSET